MGLSESEASSTTAGMVVDGSTIPIIPAPDPMALHTTLSKEHAFLQLNGRCTVEIDDQGIFISIPTFHSAARLSQHQHRHNDGIGRATFNTSRRGMRLPVSTQMKVSCASTSSLVLSVPLMQSQGPQSQETMEKAPLSPTGADDESSSAFVSPTKAPTEGNEDIDVVDVNTRESANNTTSEDAAMRDFLSSSILSIPWTYEGHNLSPEAYINGLGNKLSPEEREKLLKEAEEDSMIFAQTVVALTEFIACVPEGSKELLLCFSCADRLTRDSVVLSLRSLACKPLHTSRYERRRVLPWMSMEEDETTVLQQMSDSAGNAATGEFPDSTWKRRLKAVEEEAAALKRERNELTKQLLETKEELFVTKQKMQKASKPNDHPVGNISLSNSSVHSAAGSTTELPLTHRSMHSEDDSPCFASSEVAETATVPTSLPREEEREDIAIITDSRQLQHKLIELENKLSIATKREQESSCQREEIEQQNAKLSAELEATKRKKVDARDKLSTLQSLHDQQSLMMRKMDQEIDSLRDVVSCIAAKDSQISQFQKEIVSLQERNNYLQAEISLLKTENGETKDLVQKQLRQIEQLEVDHSAKVLSLNNSVRHLEQQLSDFMLENKRQEREILQQKETINKQTQELQKVKSLEMQLKEAHEERDSIQAELNHLQKKNDSIAKDLKRVIKENAQSISEFEKALIRKSGECDVSIFSFVFVVPKRVGLLNGYIGSHFFFFLFILFCRSCISNCLNCAKWKMLECRRRPMRTRRELPSLRAFPLSLAIVMHSPPPTAMAEVRRMLRTITLPTIPEIVPVCHLVCQTFFDE